MKNAYKTKMTNSGEPLAVRRLRNTALKNLKNVRREGEGTKRRHI